MPSKKKKYNARFPPARIKKIMQTDEDVGKVAAAVPVIISRSLELFIDSLIEKTASITKGKNAKTLSTSHVKQAIHSEKTFDFLQDLVANVPDHQTEDEVDNSVASSSGTQEKKIRRPRKPKEEGARGPGRPRKVKVQEKKESSSGTESDEETETDEEHKFETETGSLHETQLPFISPPQASSSNVALDTSPGLNSSQHNYTPQHTNHVMQTLPQIHPPAQTPQTLGMTGMTHSQSPPSTHPLSQTPPQTHPPTHVPPNTTNTSNELSQSNQYSHPPQSDVQTRQQFQSIPSYQMHNIPISQYPFSTGAPTMGTQPFIHPHTNLSMNSNNNPQFINQGMHQYPPQFVPPPYMVPAGPNSHGQNMSVPNMPQGMQPMPIHPPMVRQFMEPVGYDGNRHEAHVADTNMPLDMSMSTKSRSQNSSMPQDSPLSGEPVNMSRIPHGLPLSQGLMHGAYPQGQYTSQSAYFPGQNCGQDQPLPHSSPSGGPSGDMSLKAALYTEGKHKSNEQNTKNEDTKKNILSNRSTDKQRDKKSQKVKDNCEQKKLSLAELSNIMSMKPSRVVNDDDNDYDT